MRARLEIITAVVGLAAFPALPAMAQKNTSATADREADERAEQEARGAEGQAKRAREMLGILRETGVSSPLTGSGLKGAPFSAEAVDETVQKLEGGGVIEKTRRTRLYRDSQGRTREEILGRTDDDNGPGSSLVVVRTLISDPNAGFLYLINPRKRVFEQAASPWRDGRSEADREEDRREEDARDGSGAVSLGKRTIEGVEAEGWRRTRVIEAGRIGNDREIQVVSERWRSPELQVEVLRTESDPRRGTTTRRLTNIQRIEPLPALFEPPPGYEEKAAEEREH